MENFEVSLVKYLCPICGKEAEDGIILNSLLTEEAAKEVKELHGKTVGFTDHACKDCAKYKDEAVFFIGIDEEKSLPNDPYRTGNLVGVRKDAAIVNHCKDFILELKDGSRYCFMEYNVGKEIGLWN